MDNSAQELYLFHLVHDHVEFRLPEILSICELIGHPNCIANHNYANESAAFTCQLPNDHIACEIAKRSFLLKSISKLFYVADNFESLLKKIETNTLPLTMKTSDTFKIEVHSFGKNYTQNEKIGKIEKLIDSLKFDEKMKVCMNNDLVNHRFYFIEDWVYSKNCLLDEKILKQCYFGRFLCEGQNLQLHKYNLKDRGYIGNTSMDPLLALIMSNMGKVRENDFIYDPFVGTGSILVAAAHFGGFVCGADLDYNLIHSRGLSSRKDQKYRKKDQNIRNNLKQYGFEDKYIDVMVADFATKYIRDDFKFDAIVTDPPYGIREKAKKLGTKKTKENLNDSKEEVNNSDLNSFDQSIKDKKQELPVKQHTKYKLGDIFSDLLQFAAIHLNYMGRLVFWLPVYLEQDRKTLSSSQMDSILKQFIPANKYLNLTNFSEQRLSMHTSRLLVTMTRNQIEFKIREEAKYEEEAAILTNSEGNYISAQMNIHETGVNYLNNFRDNYFSPKK